MLSHGDLPRFSNIIKLWKKVFKKIRTEHRPSPASSRVMGCCAPRVIEQIILCCLFAETAVQCSGQSLRISVFLHVFVWQK